MDKRTIFMWNASLAVSFLMILFYSYKIYKYNDQKNRLWNTYLNDEIGKLDLLIQNDINLEKPDNENLCAGFMVINSNEKTREFFNTDNIPREIIMNGLHDQGYINSEKEKLNYKKLPSELFPNGSYFYKNFKQINPKIIHFNYVIGRKKITTMKKYGEWYL